MESNKETLRRAMRARRAALDAATVRLAGDHLVAELSGFAPYLRAEAILVYIAIGNEVPTAPIVADAFRRGKRVFAPAVSEEWFVELAEGEPAKWATPSSAAPYRPKEASDLILVPLLAWSPCGARLGRGGGWYDRILPRLGLTSVGAGYEFQARPHVPTEPWDVRLDYVVTESRLVECGGVLSAGRLSE